MIQYKKGEMKMNRDKAIEEAKECNAIKKRADGKNKKPPPIN